MATIGQTLLVPEDGWRRYNDTDSKFTYIGNWHTDTNAGTYLSGHHYIMDNTAGSVKFVFFGSKLRIIGHIYTLHYSANINVKIDGVPCGSYSEKGALQYQILLFEKIDLGLSEHHVEIYTTDIGFNFDAIDIDNTGYLANPIPVILFLIQDGNELKTISGGNLLTVCNTTDDNSTIESAFSTSGLDNLTSWNNSLASQIVNNTFKVAIHRKYVE